MATDCDKYPVPKAEDIFATFIEQKKSQNYNNSQNI